MRYARPNGDAADLWEIATPPRHARLPGVSMAGFRANSTEFVDMSMVPYPAVTVFFDFGDALLVDDAGGQRLRGSVVVGLAPGAVFRGLGRDIDCLQVRLSPVLAHAVLGPSAETAGTVVALSDLWGRDATQVYERLRAAASWEDRFAIAEAALAQRLESGRAVAPEVAYTWGQMVASRGQARVEDLAAGAGWSRKRLWSQFRSQLGLRPKHAAQLVRFDHAAHRLAAGQSPARVAADSGYADQSHLNRDVMAFAGMTPTAVASAPWLLVDPVAWAAPAYLS